MDSLSFTLISINILIFFFTTSSALDTITPSQSVSDRNTIISTDGSFVLGFFSPGSSKNRHVGIWYKKIPVRTIVWVANRQNPINDSSGLLMINSTGNLVLLRQNKSVVWSMNLKKEAQYPIVQLLDSRNLVLRDARDGDSDKECKAKCLQNCSCMAYTNLDIRDDSGCAIWCGDLIDIRSYPAGGQDLYIQMSASELETNNEPKMKIAVIIEAAIVVVAGMLIVSYFIWKRRENSEDDVNQFDCLN